MFKKHGITTIRNFDALNDVRNLQYSGEEMRNPSLAAKDHAGFDHDF